MYGAEELFRFGEAASWRVCDDGFGAVSQRAVLVGQERAVLVGEQEARHDGVDAQVRTELAGQLGGHVFRVVGDGSLCCSVAHDACEGAQCTLGTEVHDGTLPASGHYGDKHLSGQDCAEEVQFHHLAEVAEVEVEEGLVGRDGCTGHVASGSIEQDIDGAEASHDVVAVLFQQFFLQHVAYEEECFAFLAKLGLQFLAPALIAAKHDNLGSLLYEIVGNVPAKNAVAASEHDYFSLNVKQISHCCVVLRC